MRRHFVFVCAATAAVSMFAGAAVADTVYLKNGRIFRSSSVRVENDRVYVRLHDGEVAFPMSMVDRIVEDAFIEPESPTAGDTTDPDTAIPDAGTDPNATGAGAAATLPDPVNPGAGSDPGANDPQPPPPPDPEATREYWQARLQPLNDEIARIDREIAALRTQGTAQAQRDIDRGEARRTQLQSQIDTIVTDARRRGIPAGWLR